MRPDIFDYINLLVTIAVDNNFAGTTQLTPSVHNGEITPLR